MRSTSSVPPSPRLGPPSGPALRAILELSGQLLCACDLFGRVLWCNSTMEQVLGWTGAAVLGSPFASLLHPDEAAVVGALVQSGAGPAPGVEQEVRARARHADGSWRSIEWTIRRDPDRALLLVAGRDLAERHQADVAVRVGEARLRAIVERSPSPMFVQDLQGRYLLVNEEWANLTGCPHASLLGVTDAERQLQDASELSEIRRGLAADGSDITRDVVMHTPHGARNVLLTEFLLRDDDGKAFAVGGIASDITDRERLATSLAERERVLETVLQASPDIISLLDRHGNTERISAAEQTILGHRHPNPLENELFSLVHPDDFDEVASAFIRMVTGSTQRVHVRYRVKNTDGLWVTMDSRGQAIVDDSGTFVGAVVVSRDVSRRLESEQRLLAVRQAAEQASKAKSDFLSRMSHELRTPLNSVLGFAQLLQMDDLPLQQADAVDHVLRGGQHLLELIDDVLDIARIETGHLELSIKPTLVREIVDDAVKNIGPEADRADVVVQRVVAPDDAGAVLADRRRLLQVLVNLVSNAVKYNRPGGRVDISWEPAPEGQLRIVVADTGRGIRPEDLGRVFEPFDRLGAEQSGVEGTGVGLALSRSLVAKMGGSLEVESVPDVGSTFFLDLPMAVLPEGTGRQDRPCGDGHVPAAFRVMLVEPELSSLDLVQRVLSRRPGVVVLGAMHGRRALELAREHHPDLMLLDLQLPDMSGATLLERLGEQESTAAIPVAVLSSERPPHQVRRLLGQGIAGHVTKPIDVRALLSLVDAVRAASGR